MRRENVVSMPDSVIMATLAFRVKHVALFQLGRLACKIPNG